MDSSSFLKFPLILLQTFDKVPGEHFCGCSWIFVEMFKITHSAEHLLVAAAVCFYFDKVFPWLHISQRNILLE